MHSIADVLASVMEHATPLDVESVDLADAAGRHLGEVASVQVDAPPFDNSAMDGYAVRAADLASCSETEPVRLPILSEVKAGEPAPSPLAGGGVARIFTGAPLPSGADAVVMQERVRAEPDHAVFTQSAHPGDHIRRQGENQRQGAIFLKGGALLDAGALGWLASQDYAQVTVYRRPRVAIISIGDELRAPGTPKRPGSIVDSNGVALAALVSEVGGVPQRVPRVPDDRQAIGAAFDSVRGADVVLTIGGASVGDHDFVREVFQGVGGELMRWRVALKPGKPVMTGTIGSALFIGLPGNAVSAMVTFEVFVRPALRRMLGDFAPYPGVIEARLGAAYRHRAGRVELARTALMREGGAWRADLHPRQSSAALESMVGLDGLAILPASQERFEMGEMVGVIPRWLRRGSTEPPWG